MLEVEGVLSFVYSRWTTLRCRRSTESATVGRHFSVRRGGSYGVVPELPEVLSR